MVRNQRSQSLAWMMALGLPLALIVPACGGDDSSEDAGMEMEVDGDDFEACLATIEPLCVVEEADTGEKLGRLCQDLTVPAVPLTSGEQYGPMTIAGGPYGGTIEWNVGADTEFVNAVNAREPICLPVGVQTFMEPDEVNAQILNTRDIDYSLYTIFRPACMKDGETYPVITWANGTCGLTHGYGPLLATVASHGFIIIASNSSWTATPPTDTVQQRALDYAEALNEDPDSMYYQRLNLDRVGAMGHSQGAGATIAAASDPRIDSIILWNGGTSADKPFLNVSGDRDIDKNITPESMATETEAASQPGAWVYYNQVLETGGSSTGHLVLMMQPERVTDLTIAWWKYMLEDDAEAEKMFVGDDCSLCNRGDEFDFGVNSKF